MPVKKNDKWHVDIRPEGRSGKRIRRSFSTRPEALRFEAHVTNAATHGKAWNPSPTAVDKRTLSELVTLWHDRHGQYLKEGKRVSAVVTSIAKQMGDPVASQMTATHFLDYRKGKQVKGQPAAHKTLNNHLGHVNAVINELIRTKEITWPNPFTAIRPIQLQENSLFFLEVEQIRELLAAASRSTNPHLALCCRLALETGARWSEAEGLQRRLIINDTVTYTDTKGRRNRTIPISAALAADLLEHSKKRARVFGGCMSAFDRMKRQLSFEIPKGQSTHVLRHTFASHFVINGGNIVSLQRILGHVDIKSTMVYIHLARGHMEDATRYGPLSGGQFVDTDK